MMKQYDHYTLEDFVQDPYFRRWALGTLDQKDTFWDSWMKSNPEKEMLVQEACSVVVGLDYEAEEIDAKEIYQEISKIQSRLNRVPFFRRIWFSYAAALLTPTLALLGFWLYSEHPLLNSGNGTAQSVAATLTWHTNDSYTPKSLTLADGSVVQLGPQSKLALYPEFGQQNRSVRLVGEATFDVVRKPEVPFIVHSHNVITKVLGTVFEVRAYEQEANVSVSVKSGKVTVQKEADGPADLSRELVLTPNQQAVISKANDDIVKTLVENPGVIRVPEHNRHFKFSDTPISEVFATLEQAYGISIAYNEEKMAKCNLTGKLVEEDLFDGLEVICETIQARYRIVDGQIVISGAGCE